MQEKQSQVTEQELLEMVDKVAGDFKGQLDDLYKVIGMLFLGRLFGWRVMRLVASPKLWTQANRLFGDPKLIMPERGKYAGKSVGLRLTDEAGRYWDAVKGIVTIPAIDRKQVM